MSTAIDQKTYLQKYLSGSKDKKKKKKKVVKGKGFRIIDDDVDITKLRPLDGDELDIYGEGEDAPQIAGIIDDRPEEIKKLEQFSSSSKWRVISKDDGFSSKLQVEEIKMSVKEKEKENEVIFGKMYSDSEDDKKNNSDTSPSRKHNKAHNRRSPAPRQETLSTSNNSQKRNIYDSDSDISPPRREGNRDSLPKKRKSHNTHYDSDLSPPRKKESHLTKERVRKPSRWGEMDKNKDSQSKHNTDALSERHHDSVKHGNSSPSYLRKESPSRWKKSRSADRNSKTFKRYDDSDISPPRKSKRDSSSKKHRSSESDLSPPRKQKQLVDNKCSKNRHQSTDSDQSPPRKANNKRNRSPSPWKKLKHKHNGNSSKRKDSDSDLSPVRKRDRNFDWKNKRKSDSPPPSNKKMAKTLEGKMAGLQDAKQLRLENNEFRRKEDEAFKRMNDEVSGRNARVVSRKSQRETSEERRKQVEKAERQKELDEKYKRWGKGVKQQVEREERVQEFLHESSKPLARHRDDADLEDRLKMVEREGDPMLQYIKQKKREKGELGPEKPTYKGNFPPNRFNIRPGYRWDGVDRSNGYEKKFFEHKSKRKAQEEEAYKWSTEDL